MKMIREIANTCKLQSNADEVVENKDGKKGGVGTAYIFSANYSYAALLQQSLKPGYNLRGKVMFAGCDFRTAGQHYSMLYGPTSSSGDASSTTDRCHVSPAIT